MNRVMDGVRPTFGRPTTVEAPRPKQPVAAALPVAQPVASRAFVTGLDGIRRPMGPAPRESFVKAPAAPVMAAAQPASMPMAALPDAAAVVTPAWKLPSLRLPQIGWRRPAIAFGLVATALIASTAAVNTLSTPQTSTARAATSERPAASPTPSVAAAVAATPAPTVAPQKTGLQTLLDTFAAANPDKFGIVVKDMTTGETASISPDRQIESASLYKLFVAQRILQRIDLGQLTYGQAAGGGTGRNINDCLTIMINISDNGCGRALGTILGWGSQNQALAVEGYKETDLATPQQTSAGDVATLFTRLYDGTLLSANSTNKFLGLLKDQRVNNRLPVGLPSGTIIAHKTGDLDGVVHDAGIVYGPKTNYLVVVTSGNWNTPGNAPPLFVNLSRQLWNYFEQ